MGERRNFASTLTKLSEKQGKEAARRELLGIPPGLQINFESYCALKTEHLGVKKKLEESGKLVVEERAKRKAAEQSLKETQRTLGLERAAKRKLEKENAELKRQLAAYQQAAAPGQAAPKSGQAAAAGTQPPSTPVTANGAPACSKAPLNSRNSSTPPSKNPIGVRHTRSLRKPSGLNPGGQPGHPGTTLLQIQNVSDTVVCMPPSVCPVCGKPLNLAGATTWQVRQVVDIPPVVLPIITNYESREVTCTCGHCSRGDFPAEARSYISYGDHLRAFVVYMSVFMNLPYNKIQKLLADVAGTHLSEGTIDNIIRDAKESGSDAYERIRDLVAASRVNGADETSVKDFWLWVVQNMLLTFLFVDKGRGNEAMRKHFSEEEMASWLLVSDRHAAYFTEELGIKMHQLCIAHLIRNLEYLIERYPKDPWAAAVQNLLKEAVHARKTEGVSREKWKEMQDKLEELLEWPAVYTRPDSKDTEVDALKKSLTKFKDYVFQFLLDEEAPTTNNDSEKALRCAKGKMKTSGCFRSEEGADAYAVLGSIVQTSIKNSVNPKDSLLSIIQKKRLEFLYEKDMNQLGIGEGQSS